MPVLWCVYPTISGVYESVYERDLDGQRRIIELKIPMRTASKGPRRTAFLLTVNQRVLSSNLSAAATILGSKCHPERDGFSRFSGPWERTWERTAIIPTFPTWLFDCGTPALTSKTRVVFEPQSFLRNAIQ